ncbi:phospholipid carrier-dependent glycosyltransferase [Propionivibrio sp.]|uniref:phospholipid carrier-dependent glycosyltransferase n=1 Tax=Propionivibrio sp. TaxID=2212460 RepID=UPI002612277C|nr:phospholipid carrier-dependent glycosyltransferase [Propionivibrio sp.]
MALKNPDSLPKHGLLLFWLIFVIFWFATLGQRALIHPDEGRYAELSLGMLQSSDWVTPRLNGLLYFEKPALQYWMGALSFLVFGINEFAARFWPALTGILSVLAVGLTARRLWGCGQFAALVMAGSVWGIANSHFLNLDMGVTFFLTLTLCAFVWAQQDGASPAERHYGTWLAWAAMAAATLSKGLIGILIPGCTLVLYSLTNWQWDVWRRMQWLPGIGIFLLLAAPWFWLVSERNPGFAHFFFIHEHFDRFLTNEARREGPLWYFVPVLLVGFLPWISLLPRLVREACPRWPGAQFKAERFILIWALFVFAFFSKSNSKLPSYILPMFPALALLLGQTLSRIRSAELKKHLCLPMLVWGLLACAYPFIDQFASDASPLPVMQHLAIYLALGGVGFLLCAALAWYFLDQGKTLPAIMLLAAGSLWGVSMASLGHNSFGQLKSSKGLVEQIRHHLRPDMEIFSVRTYDQTFPFYLRRPVIQVDYVDEFAFGQQAEPDKAIPTLNKFITRWQAAPHAMAMLEEQTFEELQREGVAMQPVYQDVRRMVVIKP